MYFLVCNKKKPVSRYYIRIINRYFLFRQIAEQFLQEIRWVTFKGILWNAWIFLETIRKRVQKLFFFDGKMAENMGKQPKAAQNPSKYDEFLASRSGSHPKWLLTLKHQVSYIITLKTAFQNILPCLNILEFIVFLLKLNCGFPKNKADKTFFPSICTLFVKNRLFATQLPFLNRRLLTNGSFSRTVTFHMVSVKRVVLWLLFIPYGCILHPRFIIRRQSHTGFFIAKEEVIFIYIIACSSVYFKDRFLTDIWTLVCS